MCPFRTKSLTVRATKVSISLDSNQREAARITAALQLDPGRLYAGALLVGWLEFTNSVSEDGQAHHGQWIVLWPDGQLSAMTDEQFNLLFVPAAEIDPPEAV